MAPVGGGWHLTDAWQSESGAKDDATLTKLVEYV